MTRRQVSAMLLSGVLPAAAETKKHILFTDSISGRYGIQHVNGPGSYDFGNGESIPVVVLNTEVLMKALKIKGLPNGEHLLLVHLKDDLFELRHGATKQKASLRLPLNK